MKKAGFISKFIITIIILFIISQIVFLSIYTYPSKKTVFSEITNENNTDIEDIIIDKTEKRKGKSASIFIITDYEDTLRLKDYARISHLSIQNVDASSIKELSGMEINSLYLQHATEFDISNIDFKKLRNLSIVNTKVRNIEKLCDSSNFTSLSISGSDTENKDYLKGFKNLSTLMLENIRLKDISFVKDMAELKNLTILNCNLSDINPLTDKKNLVSLVLSENNITDISPVRNMKNLSNLDISHNKIKGTLDLSQNPKISSLYAEFNYINEIKLHKDISCYMDLSYNDITELNDNTLDIVNNSPSVNLFGNDLIDNENLRKSDSIIYTNDNLITYTYNEHRSYMNSLKEFSRKYIKPEWSELKKAAISYCALKYNTKHLNIHSEPQPENKKVHTEYSALVGKVAFSDGISGAYRDILRSHGIDSYIYKGKLDSEPYDDHTWNIVYIDSKPYHCDISLKAGYKDDMFYYDTASFFKKYMDTFAKSDNKFKYNKYILSDNNAPKCTESISDSAISNVIYEIVNGEDLYLFTDKEQYKAKKEYFESEPGTDKQ